MKFEELKIKAEIVAALDELEIVEPTDIQSKTIPAIKSGSDIIGVSKTGSGKTLAFSVEILEKIEHEKGIQALVVVPVRELAVQVAKEIRKFGKYMKQDVAMVYGGVSLVPQAEHLRRADIVVGTPGRLLDHINRNSLNLSKIKIVVLDEADKMASMGFIQDIEKILQATPRTRQTLLFGATIDQDVAKLRDRYMKHPVIIKSDAHVDSGNLPQFYYDTDVKEKFSLLVHLIKKEQPKLAIVFCSTIRNAEAVARNLFKQNIDAKVMHGKMSQHGRLKVLEGFHRGMPHVLVATAVAARGLDIKGITHIFNYDISRNPEDYIHQIGRTARAGGHGKAITLLSQRDHDSFSAVLRRYPVKVIKLPIEHFAKVYFESGKRHFDHNRQNRRFGHGDLNSGHGGRYHDRNARRYNA